MFYRATKIGILLTLISLLIGGWASNYELNHLLPKNSRIGVVANFRNAALFQRAGTASVDNVSFYRRVPGLKMTSLVTSVAARELRRGRRFKVFPIYHRTANYLLTAKVTERIAQRDMLSPPYRSYISRLARRRRLNQILLITPGDIDFGNGQYSDAIWWVSGYGLFNRDFVFMGADTVFAAFNVYVVDVKTGRVLAKASGDLQMRTHNAKITWHKGYGGVSARALQEVRNVIRRHVSASLAMVIRKTGLP